MPKRAYISPSPKAYAITPQALQRDIAVDRQVKWDEQTIIWGDYDDLPMRIMNAVNKSQTATSCLSTKEAFIMGSGFTDEGLMTHVIDKDGTTLWDFHTQICPYLTVLEAFSVNFKFDRGSKITSSYVIGAESCRFLRPIGKSKDITHIKFNPYFGTHEYHPDFTTCFPVFDIGSVKEQVKTIDENYQGQIFFFGTVRPPYKFYPVPKYWSGEEWIYTDAGIKTYHRSNLDNGFFNSAMINVIGDPNQPSKNPKYMKEETGTDGVKRKKSTHTIGQEFDEQIGGSLAGTRKGGTAWVVWSLNKDQAINVQAFPVNANADILTGTFNDAIKGICIATEIDPILLTLQNNGLANAGDSVRAVIEYTQSKVSKQQKVLENFYNKIMLPNLQNKVKQEVKIKNYIPIQTQVVVEDKFWQTLPDEKKVLFAEKNIPGFSELAGVQEVKKSESSPETLQAQAALRGSVGGVQGVLQIQQGVVAKTTTPESAISILTIIYGFSLLDAYRLLGQPVDETTGQPITQPTVAPDKEGGEDVKVEIPINDNLKNMTGRQQQQFLRIIKQYGQGKLTEEQAKVMLRAGFGFTEDEIISILAI